MPYYWKLGYNVLNKLLPLFALSVSLLAFMAYQEAEAAPLSGQVASGDITSVEPVLAAGTVIDFDAVAVPTTNAPIMVGNAIIVTLDGGTHTVDPAFSGQFNTRGVNSLQNVFIQGQTMSWEFEFMMPVDAFAFLWGASDFNWTLTAFNADGDVIETFAPDPIPTTGGSNAGDYIGISASGIKKFTLTQFNVPPDPIDNVFVDNLTFVKTQAIGGEIIPIDQTALLLAGVQSVSMWMIPVVISGAGIGVFVIMRTRK
jgi:hypothetical protein